MKPSIVMCFVFLGLLACNGLESGRKGGTSTTFGGFTADGYKVACEPITDKRLRRYSDEQLAYASQCSAQGSTVIYCSNDQVLCKERLGSKKTTTNLSCLQQRDKFLNGVKFDFEGTSSTFTLSKTQAPLSGSNLCANQGSVPNLKKLKAFLDSFATQNASTNLKFNLESPSGSQARDVEPETKPAPLPAPVQCYYQFLYKVEGVSSGLTFQTYSTSLLSTSKSTSDASPENSGAAIQIDTNNIPTPPVEVTYDFFCEEPL